MTEEGDESPDADAELHRILADYTQRRDAGEDIDIEALCSQFPDFADAFRSYAEGDEFVRALSRRYEQSDQSLIDSDVSCAAETVRPRVGHRTDCTPGSRFGRYRIQRRLGEGAMGAIYLAEDTQLERLVALKIPKFTDPEDGDFQQRFTREARAAAKLDHPNICRVYDAGNINDTPFISMEYIDGPTLSHLAGTEQLSDQHRIAEVVSAIARGLAEAHDHGILHRDLKPGNVLMKSGTIPCLTDFGLARIVTTDESRLTHQGVILGTPAYMAPEQVMSLEDAGPAADIYALGCVLYELLTGRIPFQGSVMSILLQARLDPPIPPCSLRSDIDPQLNQLCLEMLAKVPEERPPSMNAVAERLDAWRQGSPAERSVVPSEPTANAGGRNTGAGLITKLLTAVVISGCVLWAITIYLNHGSQQLTVQLDEGWLKQQGGHLTLSVDGTDHTIETDEFRLSVRFGAHGFMVRNGDTVVHSPRTFSVNRGEHPVLTINADGMSLASGEVSGALPLASAHISVEERSLSLNSPAVNSPAGPDLPLTSPSSDDFKGHGIGDLWGNNSIGAMFAWIPPGQFRMGSELPVPLEANEAPVDVQISHGMWVGQTEVTQRQWHQIIGQSPWMNYQDKQVNDNNAATHLTWNEAVDYCQRLTDRERRAGAIPLDWEFRLPSEAEWEYFCRSGRFDAYCFGNDVSQLKDYAWWKENALDIGEGYAHEVGRLKPNAWGLYDVHGNVFELCRDSYNSRLPGGTDPLITDPPEERKISRGGGWAYFGPESLRCSNRRHLSREDRRNSMGLRLVLAQVQPGSAQGFGSGAVPKTLPATVPQVLNADHWTVLPVDAESFWDRKDSTLDAQAAAEMSVAWSQKPWTDFQLTFEFRLSENANGGVLLRAASPHATFRSVLEVHLGDGRNGAMNGKPTSGGLYLTTEQQSLTEAGGDEHLDVCADAAAYRSGEWNKADIAMVGSVISVKLNDQQVFWRVLSDLATAYPRFSEVLNRRSGYVGLQNYSGSVSYRNVVLQSLVADLNSAAGGDVAVSPEPNPPVTSD
ncbi:MAG: SUMF1/EgtB/PvdO family nonheme iron enzyme [Planctomycetaceae bacterium]